MTFTTLAQIRFVILILAHIVNQVIGQFSFKRIKIHHLSIYYYDNGIYQQDKVTDGYVARGVVVYYSLCIGSAVHDTAMVNFVQYVESCYSILLIC